MIAASNSTGLLRGLSWVSVLLAVVAVVTGLLALRTTAARERRRGYVDVREGMAPRQGERRDAHRDEEDAQTDEEEDQGLDEQSAADLAERERVLRYEELSKKEFRDSGTASHAGDEEGDLSDPAPVTRTPSKPIPRRLIPPSTDGKG